MSPSPRPEGISAEYRGLVRTRSRPKNRAWSAASLEKGASSRTCVIAILQVQILSPRPTITSVLGVHKPQVLGVLRHRWARRCRAACRPHEGTIDLSYIGAAGDR